MKVKRINFKEGTAKFAGPYGNWIPMVALDVKVFDSDIWLIPIGKNGKSQVDYRMQVPLTELSELAQTLGNFESEVEDITR